jgi:hypothetical protein
MFLYVITNTVTHLEYVGTTIGSVSTRWREHRRNAFVIKKPQPLYVAMREYGADTFVVSTLGRYLTYEDLLQAERDAIATLHTLTPNGYNRVAGGPGNFGWKMSDETRRRIAAKAIGRPAWNKGIPNSQTARDKMSLARKGKGKTPAQLAAVRRPRKVTLETRAKMSATHRRIGSGKRLPHGWKHSAETCEKIAALKRGRKATPETRAKMATSARAFHAVRKAAAEPALTLFNE